MISQQHLNTTSIRTNFAEFFLPNLLSAKDFPMQITLHSQSGRSTSCRRRGRAGVLRCLPGLFCSNQTEMQNCSSAANITKTATLFCYWLYEEIRSDDQSFLQDETLSDIIYGSRFNNRLDIKPLLLI